MSITFISLLLIAFVGVSIFSWKKFKKKQMLEDLHAINETPIF